MTETISDTARAAHWAIVHATEHQRYVLYTPSVLQAATAALTDVLEALTPHGITIDLMNQGSLLGERVLQARASAYELQTLERPDDQVDPIALLRTVVSAASDHLGRPVDPTEGPTFESSRARIAYVVLPASPNHPSGRVTPPWWFRSAGRIWRPPMLQPVRLGTPLGNTSLARGTGISATSRPVPSLQGAAVLT